MLLAITESNFAFGITFHESNVDAVQEEAQQADKMEDELTITVEDDKSTPTKEKETKDAAKDEKTPAKEAKTTPKTTQKAVKTPVRAAKQPAKTPAKVTKQETKTPAKEKTDKKEAVSENADLDTEKIAEMIEELKEKKPLPDSFSKCKYISTVKYLNIRTPRNLL